MPILKRPTKPYLVHSGVTALVPSCRSPDWIFGGCGPLSALWSKMPHRNVRSMVPWAELLTFSPVGCRGSRTDLCNFRDLWTDLTDWKRDIVASNFGLRMLESAIKWRDLEKWQLGDGLLQVPETSGPQQKERLRARDVRTAATAESDYPSNIGRGWSNSGRYGRRTRGSRQTNSNIVSGNTLSEVSSARSPSAGRCPTAELKPSVAAKRQS
jgi:hypothetical protein